MKHKFNFLYAFALFPLCMSAQNSYGIPDAIEDSNIFHAFNWKFTDIEEELPRIAAAGFGSIQVSPVQGNCKGTAEWFYAYMPYDLAFTDAHCNGNGTREQLKSLCASAETYGIKIIVDVVANHMNKSKGNRNQWWNQEGRERNIGAVNYNNRTSVITGNLGEYYDVVSENPEVQQRAAQFIEDLKSLGVKGIRWDAAKHIGLPSENCDFWPAVTAVEGMWHYGEILDNPGTNSDTSWKIGKEYSKYLGITDNGFSKSALTSFKSKSMPVRTTGIAKTADSAGEGIDARKVIYWGESHDNYSNDPGETKNTTQDAIDRTYLFRACRADGPALYLSRPQKRKYAEIRMAVKGSEHALEAPEIAAVNRFRNLMVGHEEAYTIKPGTAGFLVVTRKDAGALILLPKKAGKEMEVENVNGYMPSGEYKDELSGNVFTVTPQTISGIVGETGVAVLIAIDNSAVNEIATDAIDNTTVYYNLQGTRVENPVSGIYIRIHNGKSEKICL